MLLQLAEEGEPEKAIHVRMRDRAGNWSDDQQQTITLVQQPIVVDIVPDTVVSEEKNVPVSLLVKVGSLYADYFQHGITQSDTFDAEELEKSCEQIGDSSICTFTVSFHVSEQGFDTFRMTDLAGNESNTDTVYFEIQTPPLISLTLYDFTEFDENNLAGSDSQFTDALEDSGKIKIAIEKLDGAWQQVRFAFSDSMLDSAPWKSVAPGDTLAFFDVPLDSAGFDCEIFMVAQAKNKLDLTSNIADAFIIHDVNSPKLTSFHADRIDDSPTLTVNYNADDNGNCTSGVAGIVIRDSVALDGQIRWTFIPAEEPDKVIVPVETAGLHYLRAFVVDSADIDQDIPLMSADHLEDFALGDIDHPSKDTTVPINWQPEIDFAYNYPNPFNPEKGSTGFHFMLESPTEVDIKIFDLFGNLVRQKSNIECLKYNDLNSGGEANRELSWDGRNGLGEIVASGVYIAIIKPKNGKALKPVKIGVLREN